MTALFHSAPPFRLAAATLLLLAATVLPACTGGRAAAQDEPAMEAGAQSLATVPLTVTTGKGVHRFTVEVARTGDEQATGLMFRRSLAHDRGMIFPMEPPRDAGFWMRNTLIPLDLLFVRADGTIARVAADAVPLSLDVIPSGEPVAAVLELAGGEAARRGIVAGDRVTWPAP